MNIGNPTEFTIKQLAEATIKLTKSTSKIVYKPLPQVGWLPNIISLFGAITEESIFHDFEGCLQNCVEAVKPSS